MEGYNFVSLSTLKKQNSLMDVLFEPKKIEGSVGREFFGARDIEVITQFDYLDNLQSGVYSGTFIGFDPITRIVIQQEIKFDDMFKDTTLNKNVNDTNEVNRSGISNKQMKNSRRVVYPTPILREKSDYIKTNDLSSLNIQETPQYFVYQRRAILKHLFSQRLKVALPGNFALTSGKNLNIKKQKNSAYEEDTEDKSLFGKYLIVATRHILKPNGHETLVEVVTDSTDSEDNKSNFKVDMKRI
jgi:hypothetical protein